MIPKVAILLVATVALSLSTVTSSYIYDSFPEQNVEDVEVFEEDDFSDEPVYQPRFLPIFNDAASLGKVVQALQNPKNKTLQDDLINIVADLALKSFGGDETVKKVVEVVKNRGNKTFQEVLMNVGAEIALVKFKGDDTVKSIAEILKNPTDEKLQDRLMTLVAEVGDSKLGKDGTLQKVAEVLKKPGNRTLQENLLNVVVEVSISKFGNDELIRKVAEVFQESGNKTVQENLLNLATNVALIKYGDNPIVKVVAEVIQSSGNQTAEERIGAAVDAALNGALGPVQAAIIKQGIGIAGQALKVGGSMLGNTLTKMGGDSLLGKAGQALSNGTETVGGLMSKFGGGDKGVGLAIEKFGEAMKGENASIQEAFVKAGSALNGHDAALTKEVDVLAEEAQTIGDEVGEAVTEIEEALESESSAKGVTQEDSVGVAVATDTKEAVETSVSELVAETPTVENSAVETVQVPAAVQPISEGKYFGATGESHDGIRNAREDTPSVPSGANVLVPSMNSQSEVVATLPTQTAENSVNSANGVIKQTLNQLQSLPLSQATSNLNTSGDNSAAVTGYGGYSAPGSVATQIPMNQGGNQNVGGALGSASAAIEAARHALQAGSEALGGALGNIAAGGSTGQGGVSGPESSPMSIEITTVKLQMG